MKVGRRTPAFGMESLTRRELDVLLLMADGLTNREIAQKLVVEETSVKSHVKSIFIKTQTTNRTAAALWFIRQVAPAPTRLVILVGTAEECAVAVGVAA